MISDRTVLVLGAGASVDYQFPAGSKFRNELCQLRNDSQFIQEVEDFGVPNVNEFLNRFCRAAYSSPDRWLEDFPDYIAAGKYCIARVLKGYEDENHIIPPDAPTPSWYELLMNKLELGTESYFDKNLTVLTFNYDRSLEHYMWLVIQSRFQDDHRVMDEIWSARPEVVHLHGQLGTYDRFGETPTPFRPLTSIEDIHHAQEDIRIISDVDPNDQVFDVAEAALKKAARVYILGFGFDRRNIERLRYFPQHARSNTIIGGTRIGIPSKDWGEIEPYLFQPGVEKESFDRVSIYEFLSKDRVLV